MDNKLPPINVKNPNNISDTKQNNTPPMENYLSKFHITVCTPKIQPLSTQKRLYPQVSAADIKSLVDAVNNILNENNE